MAPKDAYRRPLAGICLIQHKIKRSTFVSEKSNPAATPKARTFIRYYGWRGHLPQRDIDSINAEKPDLICFTGDLQNVTPDELPKYQALLSSLKARDGVMSVLGNHDYTYYMDVDDEQEIAALEKRMQDFQRSCGWHLLMNEHVAVHRGADSIYVAGTENYDKPKRTNVRKALYGIRPGSFVLMLQHIPKQWSETWPSTINKEKDEDGDVIGPDRKDSLVVAPQFTLSGHTHAGQISILGLRPSMFTPYDYGLFEEEGCQLYTTSGLGGTVPIRIHQPSIPRASAWFRMPWRN